MNTELILAARLRLMEYSLKHPLDELLRETLDEAESLTGSCIGFYHFLDSDQQMLTPQAWSTRTSSLFCKADSFGAHYSLSQAGVWADCIRERCPVIHNDYASLQNRKGMPAGHATVVRELVVPVFRNDIIVAIIAVGNKQIDYDQHDVELIKLLADLTYDIAEHKKSEEEKQILEQQLHQTQKLESIGLLAGGIAHDFNNILSIIIGNCSLAKMRPETAITHIAPIENAAERAAELCRQMLVYAGKTTYVLRRFNMRELVEEMVKMLRATIGHNVMIRMELSNEIPVIKADASQIRQIIMNLIINATEAIGEEQGEICISLGRTEFKARQSPKDHLGRLIKTGEYLCLNVSDNGCGMTEETQYRIFEPFFTTKVTGRGLGMSAVLGIINAHKGALQLSSQPGQGADFKIYLPVQGDGMACADSQKQVKYAPWQAVGTILMVEDEDTLRLVVKIMLKKMGLKVIEASNGLEALDLYHENASEITLVLTDIGMPVMDGYQLFRELKNMNPALPIIVSSGFGDSIVSGRINTDDVAGLISKPYRYDQLQDAIKNVFKDLKSSTTL